MKPITKELNKKVNERGLEGSYLPNPLRYFKR
jgi:hypothetical protein